MPSKKTTPFFGISERSLSVSDLVGGGLGLDDAKTEQAVLLHKRVIPSRPG